MNRDAFCFPTQVRDFTFSVWYYMTNPSPLIAMLPTCREQKMKSDSKDEELGRHVEFAQGVQPANYRLFQLADLVCSIHLIERRLEVGDPMTTSEMRLFGGPRDFKRNILKKIKTKEIR